MRARRRVRGDREVNANRNRQWMVGHMAREVLERGRKGKSGCMAVTGEAGGIEGRVRGGIGKVDERDCTKL